MLNRQKTLLYILEEASRPVTHMELTKLAFLLRHDMNSAGGCLFYDFLPYQWGPFSFCLYREVEALVRDGHVIERKHCGHDAWALSENATPLNHTIPGDLRVDVADILNRFRDTPTQRLVDYVYKRFPEFTVNSRLKKCRSIPLAPPAVYTAGYRGRSIDSFLNALIAAGIRRIIDVRHNPIARRYGFHKSTLKKLSSKVGISYMHAPEVGIPSKLRKDVEGPDELQELLDHYEADILPHKLEAVSKIASEVATRPSVLVCAEADPAECHRSRLAKAISARRNMPVVHLGGTSNAGRL